MTTGGATMAVQGGVEDGGHSGLGEAPTDLPAVRELPAMDRLRVRILVGTLKMLEAQLRELPSAVLNEAYLPGPHLATVWREQAQDFYAGTADAPGPKPARASTTGPDVGVAA